MNSSSDRSDKATKRSYNKRKHMRLPNGFGQISRLKGNLRNPYRAMVTVGKTPTGKPICKLLKPKAYFKTYNEAYLALMNYHENPFDLSQNMTCQELYDRWSENYYPTIGRSYKNYRAAWKYSSSVHNMQVSMIRPKHIKQCMYGTEYDLTPTAQANIKRLFDMMFDYAVEHEIVPHNYSRDFKMPKDITASKKAIYKGHSALDDGDLKRLSVNLENIAAEMALVQCYMGWRPDELCNLKTADVDLVNMTIKGGSKTEAGKDRVVPIHPSLRPIICNRYDLTNELLFPLKYNSYRRNFKKMLPDHTPHDCRKTFVTLAKKYDVDEYAIKRIVGHVTGDLTEKVYTERSIDWLHAEIKKISTVGIV